MNGIECLEHIKKIDRLRDTKVFMYSTTTESSVVNKAKDLGADDFTVKPCSITALIDKLTKIFAADL